MTTKTKKSSKTAKAKEVEQKMVIFDFCPIYAINEVEQEFYKTVRDLKRTSISFWTEPMEETKEVAVADEKKAHWYTKVVNWCKSLFQRR